MTIQTNNQLFTDLKVTKISPKGKEFHAMTFLYRERKMVIGHSATEGGKFFWYIEGRGTKETSKSEFWKWIKQYEGNDARKIAGYAKLMEPVSLGPVVDVCDCGRGVDYRTKEYSERTYHKVLCKKCQKKASVASDVRMIGGVPLFSIERLTEMKPYQREAIARQIERALEKVEYEDTRHNLLMYLQDVVAVDLYREGALSEDVAFQADEVESASDDQREEPAETAGVKAGNEEVTLKELRANAKALGIKGYSKMNKAQLTMALAGGVISVERPF